MNSAKRRILDRGRKLQLDLLNLIAITDDAILSASFKGEVAGIQSMMSVIETEFDEWHKIEDGKPEKEGVYDITYIGIDPLTNQYDTYLTTCFYSETYAAFMGYSSRVIAWRNRPDVYVPVGGLPPRPVEEDF